MKLNKLTIENLHKIDFKVIEFSKDITYINGLNGAGKSTILNAVQLGILGYIPGCANTNQGVWEHHNNLNIINPYMRVTLEFDNGEIIERGWNKSGNSVKETIITKPEDLDISEFTKGIKLPVFDFNQFIGQSANAQKSWWIDFVSSMGAQTFNWENELNLSEFEKPFVKDVTEIVEQFPETVNGLKDANAFIKSHISAAKELIKQEQAILTELQSADISEFTFADKEEINKQLDEINEKIILTNNTLNTIRTLENVKNKYSELCNDTDIFTKEEFVENKKYQETLKTKIANTKDTIDAVAKVKNDDLIELGIKKDEFAKVESGLIGECPVFGGICEKIETAKEQTEPVKEKLKNTIAEIEKRIADNENMLSVLNSSYENLNSKYTSIQTKLDKSAVYKDKKTEFENIIKSAERDINKEEFTTEESCISAIDSYKAKAKELNGELESAIKAKANKEHINRSVEMIAEYNTRLDILKRLEKLTGPSGLQSRITESMFISAENDINKILSNVTAARFKFKVGNKSGDFRMGFMNTDNTFIPYDCLSSGEKAITAISMILSIADKSENELKITMIDDILDHIDNTVFANIYSLFTSRPDIQIICAGVKDIADNDKMTVIRM